MPPLLQSNIEDDSTTETKELRHQYFLISNALDSFRKRWSKEYLTSLQEKHENRCAERPTHHIKPGSLVMVCHDNMHRYEWPLGKVNRVFPDPSGVIRTAEVEEGGRCSLCPLTFLVPLELDRYDDEEGDLPETERASDYNEAATSEADEPPYSDESTTSGPGSPITLGVNSPSTGPPTRPQSSVADVQLSSLSETPTYESADQSEAERDCESPTQRSSVGASPNTTNMTGATGSPQPTPASSELATQAAGTQPDELITQHLPRRAATRQRQLVKDLINEDLI